MNLIPIKFSSGHECKDNGMNDYDFYCPTQPDKKLFFLPYLTALILDSSKVCPKCLNKIGEKVE